MTGFGAFQLHPPFDRLPNFVKAFGALQGARAFCRMHLSSYNGRQFSLRLGGRRVWLRRTASDTSIFFQVFVKREYDTSEWPQHAQLSARYDALVAAGRIPVIIDAGANIGMSALWFNARYPKAQIYAVEPDSANLAVLTRNIAGNPAITSVHGAVWDRPARLTIANPGAGAGAFRVVEGDGTLRAFSIPELVDMQAGGTVLIVKIDIEGGESALFRSNTEWLRDAGMVTIELHDWLYPGGGTSRAFLQSLASENIDFLIRGENVFCFNSSILDSSGNSAAAQPKE